MHLFLKSKFFLKNNKHKYYITIKYKNMIKTFEQFINENYNEKPSL